METKGRLSYISRDFKHGKVQVTFTIEDVVEDLDEIMDKDLRLTAVRWREKRSLDANAYLWVLASKMAGKLPHTATRQDVYEEMLRRYGTLQKDADGNYVMITLPTKLDIGVVAGHWLPYRMSFDGKFSSYLMIKGSSDYDTAEMSKLLDGVVDEAKELGVETMTPDDIERMKQAWNP